MTRFFSYGFSIVRHSPTGGERLFELLWIKSFNYLYICVIIDRNVNSVIGYFSGVKHYGTKSFAFHRAIGYLHHQKRIAQEFSRLDIHTRDNVQTAMRNCVYRYVSYLMIGRHLKLPLELKPNFWTVVKVERVRV